MTEAVAHEDIITKQALVHDARYGYERLLKRSVLKGSLETSKWLLQQATNPSAMLQLKHRAAPFGEISGLISLLH